MVIGPWPSRVCLAIAAVSLNLILGFGGMISFDIDADLAGVSRFFSALRVFTLAESLGGDTPTRAQERIEPALNGLELGAHQ